MGSKTPENENHRDHGDSPSADGISRSGGEPRGSHNSRDGDGCVGDLVNEDDSDDDDNNNNGEAITASLDAQLQTESVSVKKKKKKSKKKKKKTGSGAKQQSNPPRVPLSELFPTGDYPEGEIQHYTKIRTRTAEERHNARLQFNSEDGEFLRTYRKAAEVHRQTRRWVRENVKPGYTTLEIAEGIEDSVRALLGHPGLETGDSLNGGMGFPTGICLNHEVAHYTPSPGKGVVVKQQDLMTVDFGVHINGWIVDSAFTMAFEPTYDDLMAAVKDATNTGVKTAGIDVRISDVSAAIQEAMESWEVEINGKTYPVKPVRNLTAHDIKHWHIHGGKSIPFVKNSDQTKMEEGEIFAIETFGSTGRGYTRDDVGMYGYGLNHDAPLTTSLPLASAKRLHKTIRDNFSTIVFCRRYLDRLGLDRYLAGMNCLVQHGIVEAYKPLADIEGSYSAQFEHTLILREAHKEILSRGEDY